MKSVMVKIWIIHAGDIISNITEKQDVGTVLNTSITGKFFQY
jgi:hypothetical protein